MIMNMFTLGQEEAFCKVKVNTFIKVLDFAVGRV